MLEFVPLVVALAVIGLFVATPYNDWLSKLLSRTGFRLFEGESIESNVRRERLLRSAAIGTPYREYTAKTYLYVFGSALAGGILGVYAGVGLLALLRSVGLSATITVPSLGVFDGIADVPVLSELPGATFGIQVFDGFVFAVLLTTSSLVGLLAAGGAYAVRWRIPSLRADTRRRQIDAGMPRMVAFVYALTRGGMAFPDVMRALSRNEGVFGEGAAEVGVAVRNIDLFNVDLVTAVQDLSQRTPSEQFEQFAENLSSVLQSGRNISEFLKEQYERYREEAEEQQEEILDLLATTAEVYVTIVVAGMLFLVTILLIIGLTAGDTLFLMRAIAYVVLPAGNLLFLAYLIEVLQPLQTTGGSGRILEAESNVTTEQVGIEADGGYTHSASKLNHERLRAYNRLRSIRETITAPLQSVIQRPTLVFAVTVPIAVLVTAYRAPSVVVEGSVQLDLLDDLLVQAAIFLMGTFAIVYEIKQRRLRRLEDAVPDLLERLASLNEAGIAVVSSFDRVRRSDIGALDEEVDRIWRDIQWGATVAQALDRFETRVRTPSVTRVVTLIANAMRASNEIGPVLRIAAEQARADKRLRRQRRQEMFTYLVVIYVSFVVFLIVIVALDFVLIPNLPDTGSVGNDLAENAPSVLGGFQGGDEDAYRLVFFHTALLQSTLSGLVGGMMGGGSVKDGVKHSTIMLTVTYLVLTLLG